MKVWLMLLLLAVSPAALPQYKCVINGQTTYVGSSAQFCERCGHELASRSRLSG